MVAVVTGNSFGLEQSSAYILGSRGQWGQSSIGRAAENIFLNGATGNLVITRLDEMLIGRGPDAAIARTYNSLGGWDGDNGDGWRASVYRRVVQTSGSAGGTGSTITRTDWDGSEALYTWDTARTAYVSFAGAGACDTISYASGVWTWTDGDSRLIERYDEANGGRITSSSDTEIDVATGVYVNTVTYAYTSGRLTKVTTADGQDTTLSYDSSGLLTELVTHHGTGTLNALTRVRYTYDENPSVNRLIKVEVDLSPADNSISDLHRYKTEYTYVGTTLQIATIKQQDGTSLSVDYDSNGRVEKLTQLATDSVSRVTEFDYYVGYTTITDASGQLTSLYYDSENQLTSIVAPPPESGGSSQTTTFTYNSRGDVISVTDPTGRGVVYDDTPEVFTDQSTDPADRGYDPNGNRRYERDSAGNTIHRTFNTANQVLTETRYLSPDTDGAGSGAASNPVTTRYAYDSENHLKFIVSAEGYVTEFVYNAPGQQTSAIQYAGHVYSLTGLGSTDAIALSSLSGWVNGLSDKSTARRIDTTYNYRGQIETVTSFGATTTTGAGDTAADYTMVYVYDQAGNLLSRQVLGAPQTESYLYDGLNRVIFSSDYGTAATTITFSESESLTTTTVKLGEGLTRVSTYNRAGELISLVESASGTSSATTSYRYDAMGRLRGVTDPTGVKTYSLYDRIGRLVGQVDGEGVLTEFGYDADGLLIRTVRYATKLSTGKLDDLNTFVADFTKELAYYRPSGTAADIWEWRLYDNAQRLVQTIDGVGAVTTFAYDGASRLIGTTQHGNRIDAATITGFKTTAPTLVTGKPPRSATAATAPAGYAVTAGATSGANTLTGGSGQDFIDGQEGDDTLIGAGAGDILIGGLGDDTMTGGTGADIYVFRPGDGLDTIAAFSKADGDLIDLSAFGFYSSVSHLNLIQSGADAILTLSSGGRVTLAGVTAATLTDADFIFADRVTRQFHDDDGRLEASLDAEGYLTRFFYDSSGQMVQTWAYATVSPVADRTSTLADLILHTASSTADIHNWTLYDRRGLALVKINGEGDVVRYQYSALGHVEQEIRGQKLTSAELTSQLSVAYTLINLPATVSGTVLERTDWTRDHYGRVLSETRTLASGTETDVYLYDSFGRLMSVTVASGTGEARTKTYRYDNQGRLIGEMYGEGDTVLTAFGNWTYDGSPIIGTSGADTLNGTAGRDLIQGLAGNDTLNGLGGDDRLEGGAGVDAMNGGDGNDIIVSGLSNDTSLTGGAGRDVFVFVAGDGSDTILDYQVGLDLIDLRAVGTFNSMTTSGADTLINLAGGGVVRVKNTTIVQLTANNFLMTSYDQRLTGTTGADSLTGGSGRDLFLGLGGNDTLVGGAGNDRLDGGAGADIINGGDGDDIVVNGTSNDTSISGGAGRDIFVFLPGDGVDTLLDFQVGLDLIDLSALGSYTSLTTVGANTRINLASGSITVNNVTVGQLTAANFIYSAADVFRAYGTTYAYDESDRLISKTVSDGTVTGGIKTLFYYDKDGRLTHTINALGEVVEYRYDSFGRQTDVITYGSRLSSVSGLTGGAMTAGLATSLAALANTTLDSAVHTAFDVANRVTSVTTAGGSSSEYAYGAFDEAVSKRDLLVAGTTPAHRTSTMTHDRRGLLSSTVFDAATALDLDPSLRLSLTASVVHDAFGRAINTTDADGKVRQTSYDRAGRVLTTTDPLNKVTSYAYDGRGAVVTLKDRTWTEENSSRKTTFTYSPFNRVVTMTTAENLTTTTVNNAFGQALTITDGAGRKVSYSYDRNGALLNTVIDEGSGHLNLTSQAVHDRGGRLSWTIDAAGFKTSFTYDAVGRLLTRKVDDGGLGLVTTYEYDPKGQQTKVTDAAGRVTEVGFDLDGRTTTVTTDPAGLKLRTVYEYDAGGRAVTVREGYLHPTTSVFVTTRKTVHVHDNADRLIETHVDPDGLNLITRYAYDERGNAVLRTEVLGGSNPDSLTRYAYDDNNRLIWTVDATGAVTNTSYDAEGRVTASRTYVNRIVPATMTSWGTSAVSAATISGAASTTTADHITRMVYDFDGRLRYAVDGLNRVNELVYDGSGNVTQRTAYATAITPPSSFTVALVQAAITANAADRMTKAVFDGAGRQTHTIDAVGAVTAYAYDAASNVTSVTRYAATYASGDFSDWLGVHQTDADNRVTRAFHDGAGRTILTVDGESYVTQIKYDGGGNAVGSIRYASKLITPPTLANLQTFVAAQSANADNVLERTLYDGAGRAVYAVDGETYVTKFVYDALGNVTDRIRLAGKYTVTDSDTVAGLTTAIGTIPASAAVTQTVFDAAGRMTSQTRGYGDADPSTTTYAYDGAGRVVSVTNGLGHATLYEYDAAGHLTKKTVPLDSGVNAVTRFEYDAFGNVVKTTDPRGFVGYSYYDKVGRLILQVDPGGYATATEYSIGGEVTKVIRYLDRSLNAYSVNVLPDLSTDPARMAETVMTRDKLDRVTDIVDAMGKAERYDLNAFGNRVKVWNRLTDDRTGVYTENTYDRRGLLIEEKLPITANKIGGGTLTGVINSYSYDSRGNRLTAIEANNPNGSGGYALAERRTTTFEYDKLDRLTKEIGDTVATVTSSLTAGPSVAPTQTIAYDAFGNIRESIDAGGYRTLYWYDELGRKTDQLSPVGTLSHWTYDDADNAITVKVYGDVKTIAGTVAWADATPTPVNSSNFRQTTSTYDYNNRLKATSVGGLSTGEFSGTSFSTASGVTVTVQTVYNALGGVTQQVDGRGNVIYQMFDKNGRVIARVDQENYLTTFEIDSEGNVKTETRHATRLTASATTLAGLTISVSSLSDTAMASLIPASSADDRITLFTYDENGRRLTETRLNVVAYSIDAAGDGDLTLRTGALDDATIEYRYDGLGNVTKKIEANGDTSDFAYDTVGRMTRMQGAEFTGWLTASTTGLVRHTTDYSYDAVGNVTQTREGKASVDSATDRITTYVYGAGGRLASVTDASGFTRSFGYDAAGHVVKDEYVRYNGSSTTALTEAKLYVYDAMGRVIQQASASKPSGTWVFGDRTHIEYSVFGEVTGKAITDSATTPATWQETFAYDAGGRMWKSNTGDGATRLYVHDANGAVTLTITPTVTSTSFNLSTYTTIELALTGLGVSAATGGAYLAGIAPTITVYDKRGQATSTREHFREIDDSGTETIVRSRAYNAFGEVRSETSARGYAASGFTTDFAYNTMGRLVQKQAPTVSVTAENGAVSNIRPTENYYFDISGRLVGVEDANSNLNKRALLAGSGHGDDEAIVTAEFRASGSDTSSSGVYRTLTDVHGDLRVLTNEVGAVEKRDYDAMGRLTKITRPTRVSTSTTLEEHYAYDGLGNRTQHWNSQFGSTVKETTDYDAQGRIIKTYDYGGNYTTYSYSWTAGLSTTGLGTFGGWEKTTTLPATVSSVEKTDYFGRLVGRTDFGGNAYTFGFDRGGRLITQTSGAGQGLIYSWYNTGKQASVFDDGLPDGSDGYGGSWQVTTTSIYTYDLDGNKLTEANWRHAWGGVFVAEESGGGGSGGGNGGMPPNPDGPGGNGGGPPPENAEIGPGEVVEFDYTVGGVSGTATWDAMNRLTAIDGASADVAYKYDAAGNLRHVASSYTDPVTATATTQSYWYRYDSMNRFVTTMGAFTGTAGSGTISRGTAGTDIAYDAAGNRAIAESDSSSETYGWSADGFLETVHLGGVLKVNEIRDALGRVTYHDELDASGNLAFSRSVTYDSLSQVTTESTITRMATTIRYATTTNDYRAETSSGSGVWTGAWLGGVVTHSTTSGHTTNLTGGAYNALPTNDTKNSYAWGEGIQHTGITYKPSVSGTTVYTTTYHYDSNHRIGRVRVLDGAPRTVWYYASANGQITYRHESPDSDLNGGVKASYFYFDGVRYGETSNDGDPETDYSVTITRRSYSPTNLFRYGAATSYADFDQSFDPINANNPGSAGASYIVADGDTLQGIAQAVWGDASLWYLIAEANGLTSANNLVSGTQLKLPSVVNLHNTSETFRPYDPNEALGNISPTQPKPAPKYKGECGVVGWIVVIIVAVVVCYITAGMASTAFAGMGVSTAAAGSTAAATATGVASGTIATVGGTTIAASSAAGIMGTIVGAAVGSIVSQGVAVGVGLQDKFSWNAVAMAAITAGVASGVGMIPGLQASSAAGQGMANAGKAFVRGALTNAISQGIATATGVQDRFDWTSVAIAGVISGVSEGVGATPWVRSLPPIAGDLVSGLAGGVAGAATRSLIDGSDFGDNLRAALPDIIGSTIGNAITSNLSSQAVEVVDAPTIIDHGFEPIEDAAGGLLEASDLLPGLPTYIIAEIAEATGAETYSTNIHLSWNDEGFGMGDGAQNPFDALGVKKAEVYLRGFYPRQDNNYDKLGVLLNVDGVDEFIEVTSSPGAIANWDVTGDEEGAWGYLTSDPDEHTRKVTWQAYVDDRLANDKEFAAQHEFKLGLAARGINFDFANATASQSGYDRIRQPFAVGDYYDQFGNFHAGRQYQVIDDGNVERVVETSLSLNRRADFQKQMGRIDVMRGGPFGSLAGAYLAITRDTEGFDRVGDFASAVDQVLMSVGVASRTTPGQGSLGTPARIDGTVRDVRTFNQAGTAKGPTEPYNRAAHYGNTPTAADRRAVGAGPGQVADHRPPLVQRYYDGDPAIGEKPGSQMTPAERAASASDRSRMGPQQRSESNSQGGKMSAYSREMKKKYGL